MKNIVNKARIKKEFCIDQIILEAKSKLTPRDYMSLCELLSKLKNIERYDNSN